MNFLDLCKKTVLKADLTSGITSTANQVGVFAKIVDWVVDAYDEIQGEEQWWQFQCFRGQATLIVNVSDYDANLLPVDFDFFWSGTVYYDVLGGLGGKISIMSWIDFTEKYLYKVLSSGRPTIMAFDPAGRVYFNTTPDQAYTFKFDYQIKQLHFTDNADIPIIPDDYHDLIWRLALIKYGEHYGASEVYIPTQDDYDDRMQIMRNRYLPLIGFSENSYYGNTTP